MICRQRIETDSEITKMDKEKATMYVTSEFFGSVVKMEIYLLEHGKQEYAQYKDATFVKYIIKGKRIKRKYIKGYNPFILLVKGWDTPEPPEWHKEPTYSNEMVIKESKYLCHDELFVKDFNTWFMDFKNLSIIADYRGNKDVHEFAVS